MALLLDTHALIWWGAGNMRMPVPIRDAIAAEEEPVYISAATAWEIGIKHQAGKLPEAEDLATDLARTIARHGFTALAISMEHAERAGRLPLHHRAPFDRMLIAQALTDDLVLISNEALFDRYGVRRQW